MSSTRVAVSNVDVVPGTEIMRIDGHVASGGLIGGEMVLVPKPSDDPNDPLAWSSTRKAVVIIHQTMFVFISILTPLSIAPLTEIFIHEFNKTTVQVNLLFGAAALALGYANLIIVPASNIFGRRPVILVCGLICVVANIWQSVITTYPNFMAARVISGLGAAANESIMPMVINDMFFIHQRGTWMGLYFTAYFMGLFVGPIIAGVQGGSIGWRWFFRLCAIAQGINFILTFFMFPETRRSKYAELLVVSDSESPNSSPHQNIQAFSNQRSVAYDPDSTTFSGPELGIQALPSPSATSNNSATGLSLEKVSAALEQESSSRRLTQGQPSRAHFHLTQSIVFSSETFTRDLFTPIKIVAMPIILWSAMTLCFTANCLLALNLTQSQVFAAPPYLFSTTNLGFVNFAFVVGGFFGLVTAGPFSDFVTIWATKRNNGVREPEMRFLAILPYVAICAIGMVVTGVGYQYQWPWEVILMIGFMFVGIETVALPTLAISYAVDCYRAIPGEIMVLGTVFKNSFGFGMIYFITTWSIKDGFIPPMMLLMALAVGFSLFGSIVFFIWGKQFRRWTRDSWIHKLE